MVGRCGLCSPVYWDLLRLIQKYTMISEKWVKDRNRLFTKKVTTGDPNTRRAIPLLSLISATPINMGVICLLSTGPNTNTRGWQGCGRTGAGAARVGSTLLCIFRRADGQKWETAHPHCGLLTSGTSFQGDNCKNEQGDVHAAVYRNAV